MKFVDVCFSVQGKTLPVDHGYQLYSSISKVIPSIHGNKDVAILPINGVFAGNRLLRLDKRSYLNIRAPSDQVRQALPLAGKTLNIANHKVRVGVPNTRALLPSSRLYCRLVIIKGFTEPGPFLEAVQRQMEALKVQGVAQLIEQPDIVEANRGRNHGSHCGCLRRTTRIRDKEIVGFAVKVKGLSDKDSITVQENGIGGRRRFGCGIFLPAMEG
jgi:CRISPR-associated protein Cas6